ncbi:MAG: chorismate mutase [archaeon]|nr:chorismate mutase [archaeon]
MDQVISAKELREEIEEIDIQIIDLLATRMDISDELAKAKKRSGQTVWDEDVEKMILDRYRKLCKEVSLSKDESEQIARLILDISRERQMKIYNGE